MNRKIIAIAAALLLPGGFIALFGAVAFRMLSRTGQGQKLISYATPRVNALRDRLVRPLAPLRQAA